MTKRSVWMKCVMLVGAVGLLLAACGGDDDDDAGVGSVGNEDDLEDAVEDAISDELGKECAFLGQFAGAGFANAFDPSSFLTSDGTVGDVFGPLADQLGEVADAAPSEIKGAFETVAEAMGEVVSQHGDTPLGIDLSDPSNIDPTAIAAFEEIGETFDNEEFSAAGDEISEWIDSNCSEGAE